MLSVCRGEMSQYDFSLDVGEKSKPTRKDRTDQLKAVSSLSDVLEGFQLSTSSSFIKKIFPAPVIPRDWKPKTTGYIRKSRFDQVTEKEAPKISNPSRDQRKSMLFPDQVEKKIKPEEIKDEPEVKQEPEDVDFLTNSKPSPSAHSDFKPFASNPEKQTRYEQFLVCIHNNRREALKLLQPKTMTEWEKERERVEFERAAILYKPMQVSMASRFVSAGTKEDSLGSGNIVFTIFIIKREHVYKITKQNDINI